MWITLILTAPIHCKGSIGEQVIECQISPNLFQLRNELIYILDGLRLNIFFSTFLFLGELFFYYANVNIPFLDLWSLEKKHL